MYRFLALDIDGTLTDDKKHVSKYTVKTLINVQKKGIRIILSSGRPVPGIQSLAETLQLSKYKGFVMAFNGASLIDCSTNEVVFQRTLDISVYSYLYKIGNSNGLRTLSYLNNYIVSEDINNKYVKQNANLNRMPLLQVDCFLETINFPEPKWLIVGDAEKIESVEKEIATTLNGKANVFRSEPYYLEVVPLNVDKAEGLCYITRLNDVNPDQLIAIGDSYNDVGMIKYAGLGVAMKNANEVVKVNANQITLYDNNEDGVAKFVSNLFFEN